MKNLLLVGWFFYPKIGGVETIILKQAKYFTELGWNVSVLTSEVTGFKSDDLMGEVKIYRRDFINSSVSYPLKHIQTELNKILDSINPQIVHFHNGSYPSASTDMSAGTENIKIIYKCLRQRKIFLIDHAHNAQIRHTELTKDLRDLDWDYLFFVSHFTENEWLELGFKAKKNKVIYNGIDPLVFRSQKVSKNLHGLDVKKQTIILFPSRVLNMVNPVLGKQKNFILLLKAGKKLLEKNVKDFQIVALLDKTLIENDQYLKIDGLMDPVKQSGLEQNIKFVPEVMPEEMPSYYAGVDIVCVPSFDETFSLTHLEAMAAGKVAIASNTGAPGEYITDGVNGFLVDAYDESDLADKLISLINEPNLIKEIGVKAKNTASKFSIDKMMGEIEKIYKELLCL